MTARDVTLRPSGSAANDAKSHANRKGAESIRHRRTNRPPGICAEVTRRREAMPPRDATLRPSGDATRGAKRIMIQPRIERCAEPTRRRVTTRRREALSVRRRRRLKALRRERRSGPRRLLLRRLPPAKARPPARRKGRQTARRTRASPIFDSGARDTARTRLPPKRTGRPMTAGPFVLAENFPITTYSRFIEAPSRRAMTVQTASAFRLRPSGR